MGFEAGNSVDTPLEENLLTVLDEIGSSKTVIDLFENGKIAEATGKILAAEAKIDNHHGAVEAKLDEIERKIIAYAEALLEPDTDPPDPAAEEATLDCTPDEPLINVNPSSDFYKRIIYAALADKEGSNPKRQCVDVEERLQKALEDTFLTGESEDLYDPRNEKVMAVIISSLTEGHRNEYYTNDLQSLLSSIEEKIRHLGASLIALATMNDSTETARSATSSRPMTPYFVREILIRSLVEMHRLPPRVNTSSAAGAVSALMSQVR